MHDTEIEQESVCGCGVGPESEGLHAQVHGGEGAQAQELLPWLRLPSRPARSRHLRCFACQRGDYRSEEAYQAALVALEGWSYLPQEPAEAARHARRALQVRPRRCSA